VNIIKYTEEKGIEKSIEKGVETNRTGKDELWDEIIQSLNFQ
jgi:hypothetical protein